MAGPRRALQPLVERALEGGGLARYEQPAPAIRDLVTGYHLYSAPRGQSRTDWFLPGSANIRISWHAKPIRVTIGDRRYEPLPQASLFGPTSRAMQAKTRGGFMVGIGVSALGWARLFPQSAQAVADTIVALDTLWPDADVAALIGALHHHDPSRPFAPLLDRFLTPRLIRPHRDERLIRHLSALLVDDDVTDVATIAAAMGVNETRLRRLAYRYFGFTPKRLLRRSRFLQSLIEVLRRDSGSTGTTIAQGYFDQSHFIREAREILGMTPGQFAALDKPFLEASLAVRPQVLGAATQVLHEVAAPPA